MLRGCKMAGGRALTGCVRFVFVALMLALGVEAWGQQPVVDRFVLDDTIQPVAAGQLDRALTRANTDGAAALLIELDTPGGLVDSMRHMAGAILSSRVPVVVYVAPPGARAGSAGFFLLEAADIAAMAPGTNAGAAHVVFSGYGADETLKQKAENDVEAFMRSYVTRRGRNLEAAIGAVQSSKSYSAEEALAQKLVDVIASSDADLMRQLDGRTVTRMDGSKVTLHVRDARIQDVRATVRETLLGWLVNPNIAMLFLAGGVLLIYLEFNTPGTTVPGALGTLMVLLAIFALNLLPIRFTAVALLVGALVLLALEAKIGGHGALAVAGIICLTLGMLTLVAAPIPEMRVRPWLAISISLALGVITVFLVRLAVRAKRAKSKLGIDALVGHTACAMEVLAPEGHVLVDGEIWRAVADREVQPGTSVRVTGHAEYLLQVTPEEKAVTANH